MIWFYVFKVILGDNKPENAIIYVTTERTPLFLKTLNLAKKDNSFSM